MRVNSVLLTEGELELSSGALAFGLSLLQSCLAQMFKYMSTRHSMTKGEIG